MVKIEFEDIQLQIPAGWHEIELQNYEKWFMSKPESQKDYIEYIADICQTDAQTLMDAPAQIFDIVCKTIQFVFQENIPPQSSIEIENINYYISTSNKLTLAEWVDVDTILNSKSENQLSEILSILCRPANEKYDPEISTKRQEIFRTIPCSKALPLVAFFLHKKKQSEQISNHFFQATTQIGHFLKDIETFAANGDGIKRLPIWQKIKYTFLTRSLKKQWSKFSDFYFTDQTKEKQKLIN